MRLAETSPQTSMSLAANNENDEERYVIEGVKNLIALSNIAKLKERENESLRKENQSLREEHAKTVELERERVIHLKNIEVLRERVEELENTRIDVNRRECGTQVEVLEVSVCDVSSLTKEKISSSDDTCLREEIDKLIKCMEELSEGRRIEDLPESFRLEPPPYYYSSDTFSRTVDILKTIMKGGRFLNNMINDFWCSLIQRAEQIELVIKDKTEKSKKLAGDEIIRLDIIHAKEKKAFRTKLQETERNLSSSLRELEEYKKLTANEAARSQSDSQLTTGSEIPSSTINEHQKRFDKQPPPMGESAQRIVTLASSKDAWKPDRQKTAEDISAEEAAVKEVCKKVRSLMNKVTPTSQGPLTAEFISYNVSSNESQLTQVVGIVFDKAVEEPKFCALYTEMCKAQVIHELAKSMGKSAFRNTILTRTQSFFQDKRDIDAEKLAIIEKEEDPVKREAMLIEEKQKFRRRKFGVVAFIGYLYRNNLLSAKHVHSCSLELFASILPKKIDEKEQLLNKKDFDEESIHCGLQLIETVGVILDNSKDPGPALLDQWFKKFEDAKPLCSNKIRFMIMNLNELRKDKWVPRKSVESGPKKIDEIHKDIRQEKIDNEKGLFWRKRGYCIFDN
ncbi:Protein CBG00712 [Caenorhabditis briggsae]|uniref:Protein CBG00712 n=3 Tax=Caenorhabditis briggsae TaxID=6238 RepID=A8WN89_CAEBR|nr:Protein CBG00712 [Caenorhabditis briggsae]ULU04384.1 hypothetical protein L3Y34_017275 [Caenorhabditis briggsae]CAP21943.1 Protein CBG00712 [Caenorhabditis briggsae]